MGRYNSIPGGRGPRFDKGLVDQRESDATRVSGLPQRLGWYVANHNLMGDIGANAHTANELHFSFCGMVPFARLVDTAKITVHSVATAGAVLKTALYRYIGGQERKFVLVPGTEVSFSAATTGIKTITLPNQVELNAYVPYFLGSWSNNSNPVYNMITTTVPRTARPFFKAGVTDGLPANATVPSLTQSGTLQYVAAVYCIADLSFIF